MLWRFAPGHRDNLAKGIGAALMVTALRLALPWPLKSAVLPWLSGTHEGSADDALWAGAMFAGILALMGLADHLERARFAQFAIGVVRNIRTRALEGLVDGPDLGKTTQDGEVVSRLIGDTARVKAGLKGFLVHVAVNGLQLLGTVVAIFVLVDAGLGALFGLMVALVLAVTFVGALAIYRTAGRYRHKEGKLARAILKLSRLSAKARRKGPVDFTRARKLLKKTNHKSGRSEARITVYTGRVTWFAYTAFGLFVFGALAYGAAAISAGRLESGDLLIFVFYVLGARSAVVQMARQGARTGKILAGLDRLEPLIRPAPAHGGSHAEQTHEATSDVAPPTLQLEHLEQR